MATVSIRIPASAHAALRELADAEQSSIGEVLSQAVETYRREQLWRQAEAAYAKLHADPDAWAEWQQEVDLYDSTANDGLDAYPYDTGTVRQGADAEPR